MFKYPQIFSLSPIDKYGKNPFGDLNGLHFFVLIIFTGALLNLMYV